MRHRTGLRNRFRNGKGTYSKKDKRKDADSYGTFVQGKRTRAETIAGRSLAYDFDENNPRRAVRDSGSSDYVRTRRRTRYSAVSE